MDLWESAKDQWLDEEDPATKENLRAVYDDVMSMVDKTGTRLVQLEASLCGNGKLKLVRLEAVHAPSGTVLVGDVCCQTCPAYFLMLFGSPASLAEIRLQCPPLPYMSLGTASDFASDSSRLCMLLDLSCPASSELF